MITPEQWDLIEKQANELYNNLELEIIQEIAERIANAGDANTVVLNNTLIAQEMGILYQDIINQVAQYNNSTETEIERIFEEAGINSLEYDDNIYRLAGLKPQGLKQSKSMWQLLIATALKTHNNLSNLTMTTANTSQTQFYNAMNKAYMEVSTGVKSYSQSIIDTIKDVSNQGAYVQYPSGQHRSIESAVRTNIITSVNQTCGKLQLMRAEEVEWDLMELTAYAGARPSHAEWQGKIVSRSGRKGYLSLDDIGYGTATGFKGINCHHDWRPYYKGSTRTYTDRELKEMANEIVIYNGKEISKYDATQIQRKIERKIRQDKKDIAGFQGILTSNTKDVKLIEDTRTQLLNAQNKLKQHDSILNDFRVQTKFKKEYSRLVGGKQNTNKNNILEQEKKTIKSANTFKVQPKNTLLSNFNKYKDIDISELTPDQRNLVVNYRLYKMDMGNEYLKLAQKSSEKITKLENIKNRKSNYFDRNFKNKYNNAKQYKTEQSDDLTNLYKDRLDTLSTSQKNSIADYTGIDYEDINRSLRTERKTNERLGKHIDNITEVLKDSTTIEDMIVHRHVEFDGASKFTGLKEYQLKDDSIEELNKLLKGKECIDKAFISTSIRDFKDELREVVYDIYMPKGTKGLYINELSTSYKDIEYEFLLQRETKFKIQEVFRDTDETLRIVMEVLENEN